MQSAYDQIDEYADEHGLWLELGVSDTTYGETGMEWRRMQQLDLRAKVSGLVVATQLIISTPERAAAELLHVLTVEDLPDAA